MKPEYTCVGNSFYTSAYLFGGVRIVYLTPTIIIFVYKQYIQINSYFQSGSTACHTIVSGTPTLGKSLRFASDHIILPLTAESAE